MNLNLLNSKEDFIEESFEEFERRYIGFGKDLYTKLRKELPSVFNHLVFYRRTNFQQEDSYAEYKNEKNIFGIQLDPLIEVIVIFNQNTHIEVGYWQINSCEEAVNFIKSISS